MKINKNTNTKINKRMDLLEFNQLHKNNDDIRNAKNIVGGRQVNDKFKFPKLASFNSNNTHHENIISNKATQFSIPI